MANLLMVVEHSRTERIRSKVENKIEKLFKNKWLFFSS